MFEIVLEAKEGRDIVLQSEQVSQVEHGVLYVFLDGVIKMYNMIDFRSISVTALEDES